MSPEEFRDIMNAMSDDEDLEMHRALQEAYDRDDAHNREHQQ